MLMLLADGVSTQSLERYLSVVSFTHLASLYCSRRYVRVTVTSATTTRVTLCNVVMMSSTSHAHSWLMNLHAPLSSPNISLVEMIAQMPSTYL